MLSNATKIFPRKDFLQVCFSMDDLLVDIRRQSVKTKTGGMHQAMSLFPVI